MRSQFLGVYFKDLINNGLGTISKSGSFSLKKYFQFFRPLRFNARDVKSLLYKNFDSLIYVAIFAHVTQYLFYHFFQVSSKPNTYTSHKKNNRKANNSSKGEKSFEITVFSINKSRGLLQ